MRGEPGIGPTPPASTGVDDREDLQVSTETTTASLTAPSIVRVGARQPSTAGEDVQCDAVRCHADIPPWHCTDAQGPWSSQYERRLTSRSGGRRSDLTRRALGAYRDRHAPGGFIAADGTPDVAGLRAALRDRVAAVPSLCRTVRPRGRRHDWLVTAPDLQQHIRLAERVDGLAGLERMCAALLGEPLRLDRPLWEILVVPGADEAAVGIVLRINHAVADGIAAVSIVRRLFDPGDPDEHTVDARVDGAPAATAPSGTGLVLQRLSARLRRVRRTMRGSGIGPTILLGERSPHRGLAFVRAEIDPLAGRLRPRGATVNDALLAAVASGLRAALTAAG